mmetsp:Transcript_22530/g.90317  ORF Transcript_22530/g.90317 Transcript_22530/m.90317 type:complete len:151 (-) Transcript_22530:516-968(-)
MKTGFAVVLLAALVVAVAAQPEWGFSTPIGPNEWADIGYPACGGKTQSPIDIVKNDPSVRPGKSLKFADFTKYPKKSKFCIVQSKDAPTYNCCQPGGCGFLKWNGVKYRLAQVSASGTGNQRTNRNPNLMDQSSFSSLIVSHARPLRAQN